MDATIGQMSSFVIMFVYFQNNYCFEHNFCFEHNYYVQNKQNDVELIQDFDECRQLQF